MRPIQWCRKVTGMPNIIRNLIFSLQIIAVIVVVGLFLIPGFKDFMFITGIIDVAAVLYAFQTMMGLVPRNLDRLYDRKIIVLKNIENKSKTGTHQISGDLLQKEWDAFKDSLNEAMTHFGQYLFALIFIGFSVMILLYPLRGEPLFQEIIALYLTDPGLLLQSILYNLAGFVIGLMAWRMLMVSLYIWQIGKKFDLKLQSGHPDECGGLEPLGIICLWNALITTIPAIFLGFWIFVGPSIRGYAHWKPFHLNLLPVPIAFALMSFVLPMYSVHQVMKEKRDEMLDDLDRLGLEIDLIERDLMDPILNLDLKEREEKDKLLKMKRALYEEKKKIPLWPVNSSLIKKFITSQAVPVLGLTGLGEPVMEIIKSLLDFIDNLR